MKYQVLAALVAAAFASACVLGEVVGCVAVLGLGIVALALLKRDGAASVLPTHSAQFTQFAAWIACIILFACFVLLLAPFASLPAVIIALLILSPLFGTMVLIASSVIHGLTRRCS